MLALVYALCVMAPAAAFAFGDGSRAAHCLTEDHHHGIAAAHVHQDAGKGHVHQDGTFHQHSKGDDEKGKSAPSNCCGLACFSALPAAFADLIGVPLFRMAPLSAMQDHIAGRGPDLPYRPPISLLSM